MSNEAKEKVKLAVLAIKAGYLSQPSAVKMCEENTLSEMRRKLHRMIDTVDVPATQSGRDLVFELML